MHERVNVVYPERRAVHAVCLAVRGLFFLVSFDICRPGQSAPGVDDISDRGSRAFVVTCDAREGLPLRMAGANRLPFRARDLAFRCADSMRTLNPGRIYVGHCVVL